MKKKFLSVLLIVAVLIGMAGVSGTQTESGEQKADKEQKQQENEQTAETKVEIPPENESPQMPHNGSFPSPHGLPLKIQSS